MASGTEIMWLFMARRHPAGLPETCEYIALADPDPVPLHEAAGALESICDGLVAIEEMGACVAEAGLRESDQIRPVVFRVRSSGSPSEYVAIPERRTDRMAPMTESIRKIARTRRCWAGGRDAELMSVQRLGPVLLTRATGESGVNPALLPLIERMREWCRQQKHVVRACYLHSMDGRHAFFVNPKSIQFDPFLSRLLAELSVELNAGEREQTGIGIELRQVPFGADMFFPETAILVYGQRPPLGAPGEVTGEAAGNT